jgi:hypothetical protein
MAHSHGGAYRRVEHPLGHHRAAIVRHSADRYAFTAPHLAVLHRHNGFVRRVPSVAHDHMLDMGTMDLGSSSEEKITTALAPSEAREWPR